MVVWSGSRCDRACVLAAAVAGDLVLVDVGSRFSLNGRSAVPPGLAVVACVPGAYAPGFLVAARRASWESEPFIS